MTTFLCMAYLRYLSAKVVYGFALVASSLLLLLFYYINNIFVIVLLCYTGMLSLSLFLSSLSSLFLVSLLSRFRCIYLLYMYMYLYICSIRYHSTYRHLIGIYFFNIFLFLFSSKQKQNLLLIFSRQ